MSFGLQPTDLIIIAIVALILFEISRLPEIGRSIGRTLKEFQAATKEATQSFTNEVQKPEVKPTFADDLQILQQVDCRGHKFCTECGAAQ